MQNMSGLAYSTVFSYICLKPHYTFTPKIHRHESSTFHSVIWEVRTASTRIFHLMVRSIDPRIASLMEWRENTEIGSNL